jgi:hypothetical protein
MAKHHGDEARQVIEDEQVKPLQIMAMELCAEVGDGMKG